MLPQYRRNAIGKDGIVIETIEHLMATLNGLGVTNIDIGIATPSVLVMPEADPAPERDNDIKSSPTSFEIPNTDGSARLFVDLLLKAGIEEQQRDGDAEAERRLTD